MSYYQLLGLPPEAAAEQIRAAYRTLLQLFHPDRLSHLKPDTRARHAHGFRGHTAGPGGVGQSPVGLWGGRLGAMDGVD